jgi:hypothetical protein
MSIVAVTNSVTSNFKNTVLHGNVASEPPVHLQEGLVSDPEAVCTRRPLMATEAFRVVAQQCPTCLPILRDALDLQSSMAYFSEAPANTRLLLSSLTLCVLEASGYLPVATPTVAG